MGEQKPTDHQSAQNQPAEGDQPAEREQAGQAYGSANQVQDEPLPASHHEPPRQAAVASNEAGSAAGAEAQHRGSRPAAGEPGDEGAGER